MNNLVNRELAAPAQPEPAETTEPPNGDSFTLTVEPSGRARVLPSTPGKSDVYPLLFRAWSEGYIDLPNESGAHALKQLMGAAAWRLVCRSPVRDLMAVIHDGSISLDEVFEFFRRLTDGSWQALPPAHLVVAHLACSRRVFVSVPTLPHLREHVLLLKLASRGGATATEYMIVWRWAWHTKLVVKSSNQWHSLKRRAMAWHRSGQAEASAQPHWHFFCGELEWRGYQITPLRSAGDLWEEGDAMSHCIFDLRGLCDEAWPSRFFSLRRAGRRLGTFELSLIPPEAGMRGMNRIRGRWILMDCRLSANRVPSRALAIDMLEFGNQYDVWSQRPERHEHQVSRLAEAGEGVFAGQGP